MLCQKRQSNCARSRQVTQSQLTKDATSDHGSCDLSKHIWDGGDPGEDHKLTELFGRANTEVIHLVIQGRDEWLVLTGTCLTVWISNRCKYCYLNNIHIFFILAVNYHLSFVHLTVSAISKFWTYSMKWSLYGNYWCRNYRFTIQFYHLKTNSWLLNRLQTVILPFNNQILTW